MRRLIRLSRALPALVLLAAIGAAPAMVPTPVSAAGWEGLTEYTDTYTVQHPYNLPVSDRFSVTSYPIYNTWVYSTDLPHAPGNTTAPRTEMRWNLDWNGNEHMWAAYVWIDPGTENTCFMQVKGATGGEAMYMMVKNNGTITQGFTPQVLGTNMFSKWFYMVIDFDPVTGIGHAWIDGKLVYSHSYPGGTSKVWYFKNGVYHANTLSSTHFADVQFWSGSASPADPPPAPAQLPPTPPPPGQTTGGSPPPTPGTATGLTGTNSGGGALLTSWTPPSSGSTIVAYYVDIVGADASSQAQETTSSSYLATGLNPNSYYTFTVTASDGTHWGAYAPWAAWTWVT